MMKTSPQIESQLLNRARRVGVLKSARLESDIPIFQKECVVADVSKTGMRIIIDDVDAVPDHVLLTMKNGGLQYECKVVRRGNGEIGVQILN